MAQPKMPSASAIPATPVAASAGNGAKADADAEPEPQVIDPPPPDAEVCPIGKVKGRRFEELPTDTLEKILETKHKAITDEHRAAVVAVLQEREAEG